MTTQQKQSIVADRPPEGHESGSGATPQAQPAHPWTAPVRVMLILAICAAVLVGCLIFALAASNMISAVVRLWS